MDRPEMDPLGDVIALLRPHAALSKPITARGDWGVRYASYDMPGFALVLEGRCWLTLNRGEPLRLDEGDFVLLPVTPAFEMASRPGGDCVSAQPLGRAVRHGEQDGSPDFRMLGGSFQIERANAPLLLALLPDLILVRSARDTTRLSRIIDLVVDECAVERPGGEAVLQRLLDILLIEALRHETIAATAFRTGLLAGLRDPALAKAMHAIHANAGQRWTVLDLANLSGMSRSVFAARFADVVGCAPIEYLARWRMALARDALARGGVSLDRLAEDIGYESASAFSTAFRRRFGCAPGGFARSHRNMADAGISTAQHAS